MSKCHNCGRDHDDPWDGPKMGFPDWDDDCGAKPYGEPSPIPPGDYGRTVTVPMDDPGRLFAAMGTALAERTDRMIFDALSQPSPEATLERDSDGKA